MERRRKDEGRRREKKRSMKGERRRPTKSFFRVNDTNRFLSQTFSQSKIIDEETTIRSKTMIFESMNSSNNSHQHVSECRDGV